MNQEEKDYFVISLVGIILASIPIILYITNCIGREVFEAFNYIGNMILMIGVGINIRTLVRSNWLQNNLKLKIILSVLYSNILLFLYYASLYFYLNQYDHTTKYPSIKQLKLKSFFMMDFCFSIAISIATSAVIIIYLLKKHKKLNKQPA